MNLYDVLDVPLTATDEVIDRAYKRLAKKHHPDRNLGNPESAQRFREIQVAYDVLSDPERRKRYDLTGEWDQGIDNSRAEVMTAVTTVFIEVLKVVLQNRQDPTKVDMLKLLNDGFKQLIDQVQVNIDSVKQVIHSLTRMQGRFKSKSDQESPLNGMIKYQLAEADRQVKALEAQKGVWERGRDFLNENTYKFDERPLWENNWRPGNGTSPEHMAFLERLFGMPRYSCPKGT
jgi:curved DNA-binding protein CbpA